MPQLLLSTASIRAAKLTCPPDSLLGLQPWITLYSWRGLALVKWHPQHRLSFTHCVHIICIFTIIPPEFYLGFKSRLSQAFVTLLFSDHHSASVLRLDFYDRRESFVAARWVMGQILCNKYTPARSSDSKWTLEVRGQGKVMGEDTLWVVLACKEAVLV